MLTIPSTCLIKNISDLFGKVDMLESKGVNTSMSNDKDSKL